MGSEMCIRDRCLLIALLYIRQTEIEVKDKSVDLESVLPIQTITENAVINGNGDITVGYRLLLPEVFTLSESEAQYIHERLEALLKMLPAGTIIHQQNFYYTGRYHHAEYSSNALIAENNRHFNGKEILNSYTNLYVTFTNGSRNGKIRKSASGTSLMRKLHYPFKQPYKEYQQRLTEMEAFLMNFENGLSSIQQFEIRKMDDTELNNAIYDYVNLSYETPENDATQKSVNPMAVSESGSMKIGQQHVSILSLTNEGEHLQELAVPHTGKSKAYGGNIEIPDSIRSKCSMLYPVGLGLPFNHIVNIVIEITDPDATVTAIGAQFRHQGFQFLLGAFHGCAPAAAAHGNTGPDLPFPVFIRPGAVQGIPGIAAHVAVNFQPLFPLEPPHCGFGAGAVASIHIQSAQPALYQGNIRAGCPRPQHGSAIFRHCICHKKAPFAVCCRLAARPHFTLCKGGSFCVKIFCIFKATPHNSRLAA